MGEGTSEGGGPAGEDDAILVSPSKVADLLGGRHALPSRFLALLDRVELSLARIVPVPESTSADDHRHHVHEILTSVPLRSAERRVLQR